HDLRMQPVFHWTANRILSHIAVCFVAFSLIRFFATYHQNRDQRTFFGSTNQRRTVVCTGKYPY
ncbi:MAG: hypothetical protein LBT04_00645, partial [Prevotellaceae bacterium]|nr:hypothetical protein [Prevotellaceae bacterium]